jgi:glutathione peroxidase
LYGAEFPFFSKIEVNGPNTHDVYKYLRSHSELFDKKSKEVKEIPWNFAKFLIDSNGHVVSYNNPRVDPITLVEPIQKMLAL